MAITLGFKSIMNFRTLKSNLTYLRAKKEYHFLLNYYKNLQDK